MHGCWLFLRGFVSLIYLGKLKDDEFSWSPPSIAKSKVHTVILHVVFSIFSARTIHYGVQQSIKVTYCHFWAINILASDSLAWFISSSGYYLLFIFIPCAVLYVNGCLSLCGSPATDGWLVRGIPQAPTHPPTQNYTVVRNRWVNILLLYLHTHTHTQWNFHPAVTWTYYTAVNANLHLTKA